LDALSQSRLNQLESELLVEGAARDGLVFKVAELLVVLLFQGFRDFGELLLILGLQHEFTHIGRDSLFVAVPTVAVLLLSELDVFRDWDYCIV